VGGSLRTGCQVNKRKISYYLRRCAALGVFLRPNIPINDTSHIDLQSSTHADDGAASGSTNKWLREAGHSVSSTPRYRYLQLDAAKLVSTLCYYDLIIADGHAASCHHQTGPDHTVWRRCRRQKGGIVNNSTQCAQVHFQPLRQQVVSRRSWYHQAYVPPCDEQWLLSGTTVTAGSLLPS
jgi:hypothetical protein